MAFNPSDSIAKVDEEIRILEIRLRELRSTRNSLIPIGRLTADVLQGIFEIACHQDTPTMHLSWVSKAWRTISIGSKTLWTLINDTNLPWTSIYLERSFPAPLVIQSQRIPYKTDLFSKIIEQLPRIQVLILPRFGITQGQIIENTFSQHGPTPLPHLKSLSLDSGRVSYDMLHGIKNVHHLTFGQCRMAWTLQPPSFPYLRSLSLLYTQPGSYPSLPQLFDYLEHMPALKYLTLVNAIDGDPSPYQSMARRSFTNGPRLASLTLEIGIMNFQTNMLFLEKAGCVTRETNVAVSIYAYQITLDQVRMKLEAFSGWVTSTGYTQGATHLALDQADEDADVITIEYGDTRAGSDRDHGYIYLEALVYPHLTNGFSILPILPRCFDLRTLHVLWVGIERYINVSFRQFLDVFGHLPQLEHLVISSKFSDPPIEGLLDPMSVHDSQIVDSDTSHNSPFPALRSLFFPRCFPSENALHRSLQSRNTAGLKLETLGLPTDGDVARLRAFMAEDMDWFTGEIVSVGGDDYLTKRERYQFFGRHRFFGRMDSRDD